MQDYFKRQIQLWGKETQNSLKAKSIAIVGCGGLGSSVAIALGSSGIGHIHLIDFDEVNTHNIHRQIAFEVGDENQHKAKAVETHLKKRYPPLKTTLHVKSFEEFAQETITIDLIIDCTDNLNTRIAIDNHAKKTDTPWIYGSVESFNGQVCFFEKSSFSPFNKEKKEQEGVTAPVVMHIASLQATLALRYLANLSVKKDILYYMYVSNEGELVTQKLAMPV